jgi:hypothetical protein
LGVSEIAFLSVLREINLVDGLEAVTTKFSESGVGSYIKFNQTLCEDLDVSQVSTFNLTFTNSENQDLYFYLSLESLMTNFDGECYLMIFNMGEID